MEKNRSLMRNQSSNVGGIMGSYGGIGSTSSIVGRDARNSLPELMINKRDGKFDRILTLV